MKKLILAFLAPLKFSKQDLRYLTASRCANIVGQPRLRPRNWVLIDGVTVPTTGRGLNALFTPTPKEAR